MSESLGDFSEKTAQDGTEEVTGMPFVPQSSDDAAAAPVQPANTDAAAGTADQGIFVNADREDAAGYAPSDEPFDSLSNVVIRRVRTEPAEVIPAPTKEKGFLYSLLDTIRFISLGLVIGILLVVFVVQRNDVYGESMEPTLYEHDAVFVEMVSKYFSQYDRGDIVTVNATGMPGYTKKDKIIKRIVGLPGETVTIKDGSVYINGVLLDEPYIADNVPTNITEDSAAEGYDNITLGPNEYYCLGDNRGASLDSRILGPIPAGRIKAHVIARIYPFDEMTFY